MTSSLSDDPIGPVIARLLAGEATPADEADLRRWLAGDPERERQLHELRATWQHAAAVHQGWDMIALQRRILRAAEPNLVPLRPGWAPPRRWSSLRTTTAAAAAVALVVGGALLWGGAADQPGSPVVADLALTELATRRGQRAALRLADGTRITLGVDSRLRYPGTFAGGAPRDVYLDGEAYFEVASDSLRPFRVFAGDAVTRVLGTRFAVRAFTDDRGVRVVVAEGKVALARATGAAVVLAPGDLGEMSMSGAPVIRHGVDVASHLAWVDGRIVFTDTPLHEVARRLSRWYDLDVRLGDASLADVPYTMSLRGDEAPEPVLQVIAGAVGARLERRGTAYVFVR